MKPKEFIIAAVALAFTATLAYTWLAPDGLQKTPDIAFKTIRGESITLAALRGKPVLVSFWATSCVTCMKEMPHLIDLYNDLHGQGLEIIGVAMEYDPPNQVLETVAQKKVPYDITLDIDGAIARQFGNIRLTPTSFFIHPNGRILFKKLGAIDIARLRGDILAAFQSRSG